jgi:putative ABC transport system ATP-binding protein
MIQITNLTMRLAGGGAAVTLLDDIHLTIPHRQFVAITGPSGSGKSTLLGLMAGLDRPTDGSVTCFGESFSGMSEDALARFRRNHIGIVFQSFHLIPTLTAFENVLVPLELRGDPDARDAAMALLEQVGLAQRHGHYPVQLSGGEQQRVAVARACAGRPSILLADEPTGNLDTENGARIFDLLLHLRQTQESTFVLVTHDPALATRADRVIHLRDGRVVNDSMSSPA